MLEVLIALAVISGLLTTVIYTMNHHLSIVERHKTITIGTMLAREKLFVTKKVNQTEEEGFFEPPFEDYLFETKSSASSIPEIMVHQVKVKKDDEEIVLRRYSKKQ